MEETVSHNRLLSDLPLVKRLDVCKHLTYRAVPEDTVIFREGDLGSEFYIIFTGSVAVTIKKKDAKEGAPPDVVAVLYSGDGFGELALLNDNNLRAHFGYILWRINAVEAHNAVRVAMRSSFSVRVVNVDQERLR